jgi:hypothetical protein
MAVGVNPPAAMFDLPILRNDLIVDKMGKAMSSLEESRAALRPVNEALRERMSAALELLARSPSIAQRIDPKGKLARHVRGLVSASHALHDASDSIRSLHGQSLLFMLMLHGAMSGSVEPRLGRSLEQLGHELHRELTAMYARFRDQPFPLEHKAANLSIAAWCMGPVPPRDDLGSVAQLASEASERLVGLHMRILGRLCMIAERVEAALGLPRPKNAAEPRTKSTTSVDQSPLRAKT